MVRTYVGVLGVFAAASAVGRVHEHTRAPATEYGPHAWSAWSSSYAFVCRVNSTADVNGTLAPASDVNGTLAPGEFQGTLRGCLLAANARVTVPGQDDAVPGPQPQPQPLGPGARMLITFAPSMCGATIYVLAALPPVTAPRVDIDGGCPAKRDAAGKLVLVSISGQHQSVDKFGQRNGLQFGTSAVGGSVKGLALSWFQGSGLSLLAAHISVRGPLVAINNTVHGINVQHQALNSTIGSPGQGAAVVAAGNGGCGISVSASHTHMLNVRAGVLEDGATPLANRGAAGICLVSGASDCVVGWPGSDSTSVVSGNANAGVSAFSVRLKLYNTLVGVALSGNTGVPNRGTGGIVIERGAEDCIIGVSGRENVTVASGNTKYGIVVYGRRTRMLNTRVGVALDGMHAQPNGKEIKQGGAGIFVDKRATGSVIGWPGSANTNIVSGNSANGILAFLSGLVVYNTLVGVGADGFTAVPNTGDSGIYIYAGASGVVVGLPGWDNLTVVSGNSGYGIQASGPQLHLQNTFVGVARDGMTPLANHGPSGVFVTKGASDCTIGAPGISNRNILSGNAHKGIDLQGVRAYLYNALVGVAVDGVTAVPNSDQGVFVGEHANDATIGARGKENLTVVSGNINGGISALAPGLHVLNTYVGVSLNGSAAVPNLGSKGGVDINEAASGCVIGAAGSDALVVASGNTGYGIGIKSPYATIINTFVGVAKDGITPIPNAGGAGIYTTATASHCTIGSMQLHPVVVSGNTGYGIWAEGSYLRVQNTWVGVSLENTKTPNQGNCGIFISEESAGSVVASNTVSGNSGSGITVAGANASIYGNNIGMGTRGLSVVGNDGNGINITSTAANAAIGGWSSASASASNSNTSSRADTYPRNHLANHSSNQPGNQSGNHPSNTSSRAANYIGGNGLFAIQNDAGVELLSNIIPGTDSKERNGRELDACLRCLCCRIASPAGKDEQAGEPTCQTDRILAAILVDCRASASASIDPAELLPHGRCNGTGGTATSRRLSVGPNVFTNFPTRSSIMRLSSRGMYRVDWKQLEDASQSPLLDLNHPPMCIVWC